jgi:hypothetical protein
MSSINSVSNYWGGGAKPSTPQKAGSNNTSSNVDPLTKYWGRPGGNGPQKAGSNAPSFKLSEGKLDVQATSFIEKWDANQDGVLDLNEFKQSDGLTGNVKTAIGSAELAQALWAAIAGPDGTLSAAEYARSLVGMDENLDGVITQAESDKIKTQWAKESAEDPGKANVRIYNDNVALGTDVGLDTKFALGFEEKYAKSLEEDDEWAGFEEEAAAIIARTKKTTPTPTTTTTTSTSSIDPETLALLKSLGIDTSTLSTSTSTSTLTTSTTSTSTSTLPISTTSTSTSTLPTSTTSTSTAGSDANFGFSAEVLATLRDPINVVNGLPVL